MRENRSFFVKMDPPKKRGLKDAAPADKPKPRRKKKEASRIREASSFPNAEWMVFRLAVSAVLFAFALIGRLPAAIHLLVLIAAWAVAGYDLAIEAVRAILARDFASDAIPVIISTILCLLIGFGEESVAAMILCQALRMVVKLLAERNAAQALSSISEREEGIRSLAEEQLKEEGSSELSIASVIAGSVRPILLLAMAIAVVFALLMAGFMHYNIRVAIHRAACMIAVASPFSVLVSMPVIGKVSVAYAASQGTVFRRASALESMDGTKTVMMEKACFPEPEEAKILSYSSSALDDTTFFMLVRHLLQASSQEFARIILDNTESKMLPNIVSDFAESPGGVEGVISGSQAYFGTRSYLNAKGINPPEDRGEKGVSYYLYLAGRFGGTVQLSETREMDVADIVHDFRFSGVNRCILLCKENIEEVTEFSEKSDFDDVYAGLSTENRLELINELCSASTVKKLCIRPVTFDGRCDAETEIRVGEHIDAADAATFPEYTPNIPMLFPLSRRIREIALENAFFAFGIKAVLIFLSMIGYCNLWMAAAADLVAAVAVVMNANRVTTRSLVKTFFNK